MEEEEEEDVVVLPDDLEDFPSTLREASILADVSVFEAASCFCSAALTTGAPAGTFTGTTAGATTGASTGAHTRAAAGIDAAFSAVKTGIGGSFSLQRSP